MRNLVTLVAATAVGVASLVLPVFGHAKPLPPAFGKELVPDQQSQKRDESEAAEVEEKHDRPARPVVRPGHVGRGQKLRIQLDGSEDGEDDGDEGGEF